VVRVIEREDLVLLEVEDSGPGMTTRTQATPSIASGKPTRAGPERERAWVSPSCEASSTPTS